MTVMRAAVSLEHPVSSLSDDLLAVYSCLIHSVHVKVTSVSLACIRPMITELMKADDLVNY